MDRRNRSLLVIPHFRRLLVLILFMSAGPFGSWTQTAPGKYWVRFIDKGPNQSQFDPSETLSPEAIQRRQRYSIPYDWYDMPVYLPYITQVLALGECKIHSVSRWMNAITIETNDSLLIESIGQLAVVAETKEVRVAGNTHLDRKMEILPGPISKGLRAAEVDQSYGPSFIQIAMLNGQKLHQMGYYGEGVKIAQLDAGWNLADRLPALAHLFEDGQIKRTHDFVDGDDDVFAHENHGTYVLSTMAGIIPDSLFGTAPAADYYLFRTEDGATEYVVEEDNWIQAAEWCDSLGIDIINSSLGYSEFDDSLSNHTYADMNGHSTRISIAADVAARKGILVVNSAGNSGDNPWHFITAPSDGDSVMCVGAVGYGKEHAPFSGWGPSSDGDVKPNVCAVGWGTVFAALDSTIATGNGTSFSSPITAGMAACLWQTNRERNNMEVFHAIEQSADRYLNPDDSLGYGIPDFWKAYQLLSPSVTMAQQSLVVRPNPCGDVLHIENASLVPESVEIRFYDLRGKQCLYISGVNEVDGVAGGWISVSALHPGTYIMEWKDGTEIAQVRIVKL